MDWINWMLPDAWEIALWLENSEPFQINNPAVAEKKEQSNDPAVKCAKRYNASSVVTRCTVNDYE